jgi:hypothetical protein
MHEITQYQRNFYLDMSTKKNPAEISCARNLDVMTQISMNNLRKNVYYITCHPDSMLVLLSPQHTIQCNATLNLKTSNKKKELLSSALAHYVKGRTKY